MTGNKKFKTAIRERMALTAEGYCVAREALLRLRVYKNGFYTIIEESPEAARDSVVSLLVPGSAHSVYHGKDLRERPWRQMQDDETIWSRDVSEAPEAFRPVTVAEWKTKHERGYMTWPTFLMKAA